MGVCGLRILNFGNAVIKVILVLYIDYIFQNYLRPKTNARSASEQKKP